MTTDANLTHVDLALCDKVVDWFRTVRTLPAPCSRLQFRERLLEAVGNLRVV